MEGEDYRIKYLKYKQKYTNALQNMQGGGETEINNALLIKPTAVYVVDLDTFNKLKVSFKISNQQVTEIPSHFKEEDIKAAIAILNPNAIRILPMTKFISESSALRFGSVKVGKDKIVFKGGIERVNGTPANFDATPFGDKLSIFTFGTNQKNRYDGTQALNQLKGGKNYFRAVCELGEPNFLVLEGKNLHFAGNLNTAAATSIATSQTLQSKRSRIL
jgi:hypothetical protein